ncbi:RNA-binding motif, single-stranded-interacting protein 2 [Hondaea fermentalgiana]|uniref:RNA-binding motif, single-stranded-interacting protein 2 n=1 Tax=Hondaea fermentalgiana TaxID=2315210 RepID=A0A2R5G947_9STRA|nr:RNA-binding motif, single-stranded-interacting protein 2 [Hondaea fermentalgiana]|eukprot:GBG27586.1 RNA-binding motif, single-stranded-interacting protein 2 [Hondaea fermentalgiana]
MKENDGAKVNLGAASPGRSCLNATIGKHRPTSFSTASGTPRATGTPSSASKTPGSATKASPGVSFNPRVESLRVKPGQPCSPVREEETAGEEEEFTSDLSALDKRFTRDKARQHAGLGHEQQRRQTLAGTEGLETHGHARGMRRRVSLGGKGSSLSSSGRRVSFGGSSALPGNTHLSESHVVHELKEELIKREKLDYTRQNRLNGMDIKLKETQTKLGAMQSKFKEQKKEKDELVRQINELKRKNAQLVSSKRRLEMKNKEQDETIKKLLSKVGGMPKLAHRPSSASSTKSSVPAGASTGASPVQEEVFGDAETMLNKSASASSFGDAPRRYTMAPGEVPRIRRGITASKKPPVTNSHFIRVDGLERGTNSHKLLAMCQIYGSIVHLRVTSDVVTGVLKGYVTFMDTKFAQAAVKGLREKGYKARLVDQP